MVYFLIGEHILEMGILYISHCICCELERYLTFELTIDCLQVYKDERSGLISWCVASYFSKISATFSNKYLALSVRDLKPSILVYGNFDISAKNADKFISENIKIIYPPLLEWINEHLMKLILKQF